MPRRFEPTPFAETIATGDHRRSLEALRDQLAKALEVAEANVIAQIAGRLQAVLAELAAMPTGEEKSTSDDLRRRREAKLAAASAASATGNSRKPRPRSS